MPSEHYNRLLKKYGKEVLSKNNRRKLMEEILKHNSKSISTRIAKMNRDQWGEALRKITPKEKRFILPDISSVVPPDSFFVNKSMENGKALSNTLKNMLNNNLRETLDTFTPKTGEPNFVIRRGKTRGQINVKLVDEFENKIRKTFQNYSKKDPKYGVPSNIRDIAVTEMNSVVNNTKAIYMEKALEENEGLDALKQWLHHPERSKEPRKGHSIVGRLKPKRFDEYYHVPVYQKIGGRLIRVGYDLMLYPHEPGAPLDQIISCHCEIIYITRWRK